MATATATATGDVEMHTPRHIKSSFCVYHRINVCFRGIPKHFIHSSTNHREGANLAQQPASTFLSTTPTHIWLSFSPAVWLTWLNIEMKKVDLMHQTYQNHKQAKSYIRKLTCSREELKAVVLEMVKDRRRRSVHNKAFNSNPIMLLICSSLAVRRRWIASGFVASKLLALCCGVAPRCIACLQDCSWRCLVATGFREATKKHTMMNGI